MMTNTLIFHKMQGAGNDFVVLDAFATALPTRFDFAQAAIALCDRHQGVGADGLLTIEKAQVSCPTSHFRMRMWNPDGTEDMCGNGLRCVALFAWRQKYTALPHFRVQTLAGIREIQILSDNSGRAAMGMPQLSPTQIPFAENQPLNYSLQVENQTFQATTLSTGSTHTAIFLDEPLSEDDFLRLSPQIEHHPLFPQRTSVLWAQKKGDNHFKVRIWERGVGETLACGTGACAVAVAANLTGRARGKTQIESRGGILEVDWNGGESEIFLSGPAEYVFEGQWSNSK